VVIEAKYMRRCIELAKRGIGTTRPNPSVGAVVVNDGKIIGEGFTDPYGGPHAEVNAIRSVKDESLLKNATIYVTLEPCSHYGKTPPCADLIIEKKIPNVVIGTVDTHSVVSGKGIQRLKDHGCNIIVGVLEEECKKHHKRFFTYQNKKRPYIILKWAETINGFIAPLQKDVLKPFWISNDYSKQLVHKLRAEEHAILVGNNTVLDDNPTLNVRSWSGENPIRIILDPSLKITNDFTVLNGEVQTIIITDKSRSISEIRAYRKSHFNRKFALKIHQIDFDKNVAQQLSDVLFEEHIQSVIVEGGATTLETFIKSSYWDEAYVYIGKNNIEEGVKAPKIGKNPNATKHIKNDLLRVYFND
jgi:diaminohydroxyphosphoribosylaminopyrimidine deaminase/5-amino-6-(5-phosphoribosylamino)uracil reductase